MEKRISGKLPNKEKLAVNDDMLRKHFTVIRIIWTAMLASLGIYLAFCLLAGNTVRQPGPGEAPLDTLRRILIAVSAAELVFIDLFRRRTLKPRPGVSPATAIRKYAVTVLVSWSAAESIGIFGMVLYFLGDDAAYLYFLIAVSALAMFHYRPRYGTLKGLATAAAPREG